MKILWTAHRKNVSVLKELNVANIRRLSSTCVHHFLSYFDHIAKEDHNLERLVAMGNRRKEDLVWTSLQTAGNIC